MKQNFLAHYGVPGMKWGVRRTSAQLGHVRGKAKKQSSDNYHEDYKKAHTRKNVRSMSDKELRDRLNRLNMEQQYSRLSKNEVSKGRNYANRAIKTGKTIAEVTGTALTIYNNYDRIRKIISK